MPALPPISDFTGATVTEGQFKTALSGLRDYLSGLFGANGTTATALATLGAPFSSVVNRTAAYTVALTDRGRLITTSGAGGWTLSLPAVATAGAGFCFVLSNGSSGNITIDPSGSQLINGALTLPVAPSCSVIVVCTGTAWLVVAEDGIERGSNANGQYVRLSDGTLICWLQAADLTYLSADLMSYTWTFPATFIDTNRFLMSIPLVSTSNFIGLDRRDVGQMVTNVGGAATGIYYALRAAGAARSFAPTDQIVGVRLMAIGRWY